MYRGDMPHAHPTAAGAPPRAPRLLRFLDHAVSVAVSLLAWCLLRLWATPYPCPGASERLIAWLSGAWPHTPALPPLWTHLLSAWVGQADPETAFASAQTIGHALTALSAGILHHAILELLLGLRVEDPSARHTDAYRRLAALAASLLFVVIPPVWHAAQGPDPASLGLFLCSLLATLAVRLASSDPHPVTLVVFCTLAGVGLAESLMVAVLLPPMVLFLFTTELGVERVGISSEILHPGGREEDDSQPTPSADDDDSEEVAVVPSNAPGVATPVGVVLGLALAFAIVLDAGRIDPGGIAGYVRCYAGQFVPSGEAVGARAVLLLFLLPSVAILASARRFLSGDGRFADILAASTVATFLLVQAVRIPDWSVWALLPSPAVRCALAILSAFVFAPCVAGILASAERLRQRARESAEALMRAEDPDADDGDAGWQDPMRLPPGVYGTGASVLTGIGVVAAALPFALLLLGREPLRRQTLAAFGEYAHDLARSIRPANRFVSEGTWDLSLRIADPGIETFQLADEDPELSDVVENRPPLRLATPYERELLQSMGWRALFNDWIAFRPQAIESIAVQSGAGFLRDLLLQDRSDLFPKPHGLVLMPAVSASDDADLPSPLVWRRRLLELADVPDADLRERIRITNGQLRDIDTLSDRVREERPVPLERLGALATPDGCEARLRENPTDPEARILSGVHAANAGADPVDVSGLFTDARALVGGDEGALRRIDLVEALVAIRVWDDPATANALLAQHEYDRIRDPAFWYLWGAYAAATSNEFDAATAHETLGKFPSGTLLRAALAAETAHAAGDAATEIEQLRVCIGFLPDDHFLLRRILAVTCLNFPDDLEAALPHADRAVRRDASPALPHLVMALRRLVPQPRPRRRHAVPSSADLALAAAHLERAAAGLPPPQPRIDALLEKLRNGEDPHMTLPAAADMLRNAAALVPETGADRRLLHEVALVLQCHDPLALKNRYVVDPLELIRLQRQ